MLNGATGRSQDTESAAAVLLRGMRIAAALNVHRAMAIATIKRIGGLESVSVGVLELLKVGMEDRVVIVHGHQVEPVLTRQTMMGELGLAMLDGLSRLGLEVAVNTTGRNLLMLVLVLVLVQVRDGFGFHS